LPRYQTASAISCSVAERTRKISAMPHWEVLVVGNDCICLDLDPPVGGEVPALVTIDSVRMKHLDQERWLLIVVQQSDVGPSAGMRTDPLGYHAHRVY
ncbi:MAG TPA: hypothetical protein PLS93_18260, partial [Accumulibacter sp.]|nr:hypothetical protein [Accumulibacter sp.]